MFSSRFHWDLRPNRLTTLLEARRREGRTILDLTESNPTRAGLNYPAEILRAFDDPRVLAYEPLPAGSTAAREAVSRYYSARGANVPASRILLTASTSEAYAYLFKLLTDPGDDVLAPRPSYPLFEYLAGLESIEARPYPLVYHAGWAIDLEALERAITSRTRAIVLVHPNNPTGSFVKRGEWQALASICARRNLALISDEVFSDYAFAADPERVSSLVDVEDCLTFSMSGLSKIAAFPQMKLGWIVAAGPAKQRAEAVEKLEWIADTYLSVGVPVQVAAEKLLEAGASLRGQIRARTAANLHAAREALAGSAADLLAVEGGWYVTIRVPRVRSEEQWTLDLLSQHDVLVQPGFFYDFASEAFLVASLLTPPDIFPEGIARIRGCC